MRHQLKFGNTVIFWFFSFAAILFPNTSKQYWSFWLVVTAFRYWSIYRNIWNGCKTTNRRVTCVSFYQSGMLGWNYFVAHGSNSTYNQMSDCSVKFTFSNSTCSSLRTNLFTFLLQLIVFMIVYSAGSPWRKCFFWHHNYACFIPLLVFQSALLAIGVGLLMSTLP